MHSLQDSRVVASGLRPNSGRRNHVSGLTNERRVGADRGPPLDQRPQGDFVAAEQTSDPIVYKIPVVGVRLELEESGG